MPDAFTTVHRQLIILLAARGTRCRDLPYRYEASRGGLLSYGVDDIDLCVAAAPYVDRILKGENVADLPVQAPIKFDLVVNLELQKKRVPVSPCPRRSLPLPTRYRVNRRELIALLGAQ